jgi:hypothetical protein
MSIEKYIDSRIINKHDIEVNWNNNPNFIPSQGEIILYDIDENYSFERFKIGDGITNVINLPFVIPTKLSQLENDSKFTTKAEVEALCSNNTSAVLYTPQDLTNA